MTSLVEIIKRSIRTQAKKNEIPSATIIKLLQDVDVKFTAMTPLSSKQKIYTYMSQIENLYTNVRKEITDSNTLKQADKNFTDLKITVGYTE